MKEIYRSEHGTPKYWAFLNFGRERDDTIDQISLTGTAASRIIRVIDNCEQFQTITPYRYLITALPYSVFRIKWSVDPDPNPDPGRQ